MAKLCERRGCQIALFGALVFTVIVLASQLAWAESLSEQPMLVVDPGMHTNGIRDAAVDAAGRIAATVSDDKTLRIWSLADGLPSNGRLLRTIRVPAGPLSFGKLYAVAISPAGDLVATGGWSRGSVHDIYLFDPATGQMVARIRDLPDVVDSLIFSPDGRYLAAGVDGKNGIRIYDRDRQWAAAAGDPAYGGGVHGLAFAADGRLAVSSLDGKIRLYGRDFKLVVPPQEAPHAQPHGLAFSPNGATLAVGYNDFPSASVSFLDGSTLAPLPSPDSSSLAGSGSLNHVAWSTDGQTLFAGGRCCGPQTSVIVWGSRGLGALRKIPKIRDKETSITVLRPIPSGDLLVATMAPELEVVKPDWDTRWIMRRPIPSFVGQQDVLAVSADGTMVDFGFDGFGKSPLRFDVRTLALTGSVPADGRTARAQTNGLKIDWKNEEHPTLDGKPIPLQAHDMSRSLAIHPDGNRFVLGTAWTLRAFNAKGEVLWGRAVPGEAYAVNISGDGQLVIATYTDGTIRWHRMDDGRELLALMVRDDKTNWVAWTPEGFYGATAGAFGVLRWHVNAGFDAAATTVPVFAIPRLRRPDALPLVLQERETARALGIADIVASRNEVQVATGAAKAPGARLHVLTVGVSDYGVKAKGLKLKFAHKDAADLANALMSSQGSGLYADVVPLYLHDGTANKPNIFEALAAMQRNRANDVVQGLAVVLFSGHGTMIDGQFYLVPYGVDDSTQASLKASAISASEFQNEMAKLAQHGRVLVLLDACRSGSLLGDRATTLPANSLRLAIASGNVTVLTSSTGRGLSREDDAWQHGAFTKVLLEALSAPGATDIDSNHDGVIAMSELTAYVSRHLQSLTSATQEPQELGVTVGFESDLFIAGR